MWRTVVAGLLLALALWVLYDAFTTTDLERVEMEVDRLVDLAREGGEEAVDEILLALADDYRGSGSFSRESIERALRRHVGERRIRSLETGGFKTIWKGGEEIVVPLLALYADLGDWKPRVLLQVTFGERDDGWKIVQVSRSKIAR